MSHKPLYKQQRLGTARFIRIPSARLVATMNMLGRIHSPTLIGRAHLLRKATYTLARNAGQSRSMLHRILFLVHCKGLPLAVMPEGPWQMRPSQLPYEMLTSLNSKKYLEQSLICGGEHLKVSIEGDILIHQPPFKRQMAYANEFP